MSLEILNPLTYPNWDELLLTHEDYSFFHTSAWARVLSESYGYKPLYFTATENGRLSALIPVMEVNSFLTGRRGVSLPFTDFCQPIVSNGNQFEEMTQQIIQYGKTARWKYIEWRGGDSYFQGVQPSLSYYAHTLELLPSESELLASFRDSTKRNIKKAINEDVNVKISSSFEDLKAFYRLNCITRKHHGLPPQPFLFFKQLFEHIISKNLGFVVLASHSKQVIAGAMYFIFGDKAIYKYGASDRNFQHLRPNNLVMWEAIKWCSQNGFRNFDFGRTELENEGLLQFKRGWASTESRLFYYKYDLKTNAFIEERSSSKVYGKAFRFMPSGMLKFAGNLLYKHAG